MKELVIERQDVNQLALQEELEGQLTTHFLGLGLSTRRGVSVFLTDDASPEVETQARRLVETHDNSVKTADQLAETQRNTELIEIVAEAAQALLDQIAQDQAANHAADESLVGELSNVELQSILHDLLQREAMALQRERRLVQALRHIAPSFIRDDLDMVLGAQEVGR